jgi:hypothetical protein
MDGSVPRLTACFRSKGSPVLKVERCPGNCHAFNMRGLGVATGLESQLAHPCKWVRTVTKVTCTKKSLMHQTAGLQFWLLIPLEWQKKINDGMPEADQEKFADLMVENRHPQRC